jgi:uncharacterized NAD(P)/FAD-binding protein YdhS
LIYIAGTIGQSRMPKSYYAETGRLLTQGLARTDAAGIGLRDTDGLELLGANQVPTVRLWALGPIARGMFRECTAVP